MFADLLSGATVKQTSCVTEHWPHPRVRESTAHRLSAYDWRHLRHRRGGQYRTHRIVRGNSNRWKQKNANNWKSTLQSLPMNTESQGVFHHKSIDVEITKHNEVYPEIEVERIRPMLHVTCTKWRQEPNNLGGHENCGALLPNGEWSDRGCSDKLNFACRLAIPDTPQEWNMGCGQWLRAGRKCVYVYSKPMLTWLDARSFCQQQKGDLMKFDNMDDVNWVKILGLSQLTALSDYWIGLNDRKTENTFLWADGSWADGDLL
ncbi:hypothetical protein BaRGS_00010382 [Batillaria attramentaria]|uniref:C-type lectin domain-containing protein n=1 Tax=Batillaria attramentaria TaxID=370345 RepID=A0ABD0LGC6_9CAEN